MPANKRPDAGSKALDRRQPLPRFAVAAIPDLRVFEDPRFQAYRLEFIAGIEDAYRSQSEWDKLVKDLDWGVLSKGHYFSALSGGGRFPPQQRAPASQDRSFLILVRGRSYVSSMHGKRGIGDRDRDNNGRTCRAGGKDRSFEEEREG